VGIQIRLTHLELHHPRIDNGAFAGILLQKLSWTGTAAKVTAQVCHCSCHYWKYRRTGVQGIYPEMASACKCPIIYCFSAMAHTGYKCFLFVSPPAGADINILFLFQWTFAIGLIFGITRYLTKSILPAMTAHALFDILVYGEFAAAPWWVW
jgi:hypothetical protein